ncbi:MAG: hypothetical protein P1U77_25035 [Rubripirellula sp.]|nr:hypothetical protein [Rubripirellula sp.]
MLLSETRLTAVTKPPCDFSGMKPPANGLRPLADEDANLPIHCLKYLPTAFSLAALLFAAFSFAAFWFADMIYVFSKFDSPGCGSAVGN